MSAFPKSCNFIILFPFQDSAPPPHKRPREEEEDEDTISISLNEEEEEVNQDPQGTSSGVVLAKICRPVSRPPPWPPRFPNYHPSSSFINREVLRLVKEPPTPDQYSQVDDGGRPVLPG